MRTVFTAALGLAATALAATAEDHDHRQLDAHVHGHGTLNIAIEDKQVAMELQVPGMDIVGFEHAAKTDAQKAAVDKARTQLSKALELFKLPAAAGCGLSEAKVALEGDTAEQAGHGDHDHDKHAHDHDHHKHGHDKHGHDKHGHDHGTKSADKHDHDSHGHDGHGAHSQFQASYSLNCEKPEELASISFDFFASFPGAQALTVNVVGAKGQSKYEVTRAKPVLDLAGSM